MATIREETKGEPPSFSLTDKDTDKFPISNLINNCRFELEDYENWSRHLDENGFVVLKSILMGSPPEDDDGKNVASSSSSSPSKVVKMGKELEELDEITETIDTLWRDIELESNGDISRHDFETWKNWAFGGLCGLVSSPLAQSQAIWNVRGNPRIKSVFEKIWNTSDLIVSLDAFLLWKPWWTNDDDDDDWIIRNNKPTSEGFHLDQNPFQKPNLCSVQGMMVLKDVDPNIGGLGVVPKSHLTEAQECIKRLYPHFQNRGDWCVLRHLDLEKCGAGLVLAHAGDLILWDSRTVHGAVVGSGLPPIQTGRTTSTSTTAETAKETVGGADQTKIEERNSTENEKSQIDLARLAIPVCMMPRSWASKEALKERKRAFQNGVVLSHWAHEKCGSGGHIRKASDSHEPICLSRAQRELL